MQFNFANSRGKAARCGVRVIKGYGIALCVCAASAVYAIMLTAKFIEVFEGIFFLFLGRGGGEFRNALFTFCFEYIRFTS